MPHNRRTVLKSIGATATVGALGAGTAAGRPGNGGRRGASAEATIVETAEEAGLTTLLAAVEAADPVVLETLVDDDQYTVFAPTNAAFGDLFDTLEAELGITKTELLADPDGLLTNTLLFHVTGGRRYSESVVNAPEVETLLGESFSVGGDPLFDDRAGPVALDVEASNGVVHVIDAVLTPPAVDAALSD